MKRAQTKIPSELKELKQWVVWKTVVRNGKISKSPFQPNGRPASSTDPKTWTTFSGAVEALETGKFEGVGFVFTKNDPYCGIDLDGCVNDQGRLSIEAEAVVSMFGDGAYIEYSPSGKGLHLITKGIKPGKRCKNPQKGFEIYDQERYFTITGNLHKDSSEIKEQQTQIDEFYSWLFPTKKQRKSPELKPTTNIEDGELIRTASRAKNGVKFQKLMLGDTSDYSSQSEADMAFVGILTFYTQDPEQIARIWRTSGLQREKLDRGDYLSKTISKALESTVSVYGGQHKTHSSVQANIPYIEYLRDPEVAIRLMRLLGVQVDNLGQEFVNPIDENKRASLFLPHDKGFITMVSGQDYIPLPDLYAAHVKGKHEPLGTGERALWWIRFLVDEGYLKAPKVLAKPLPANAPKGAKKLYEGFIRLLEIRTLYNAEQTATPYSWRFAEGWTGTTRWETQQGMKYLFEHKFFQVAGQTTSRTNLLTLGPASKQTKPDVENNNQNNIFEITSDQVKTSFKTLKQDLYKEYQVMRL